MLSGARNPRQTHVLCFNGNAALALDIHVVEVLIAHVTRVNDLRKLQDAVSQRRLAVVDVGDNAEVSNLG